MSGLLAIDFERDVLDALVDEAVADVVRRLGRRQRRRRELALLRAALGGVGEQVVGEPGAHQPLAGECERDPRRVDRDPSPAPLLGDVRGRAGAARRVEHEVARVGVISMQRSTTLVFVWTT